LDITFLKKKWIRRQGRSHIYILFLTRNLFKYIIIIITIIIIIIIINIIVIANETWMNVKQTVHEKIWYSNTR